MGRADTFREAMTAARSLHNRIRNHAIVSTFLLTVQLGCFAYMRSRHSRVARLREFFFFFFQRCSSPQPLPPRGKGARESRCIGSLGIVPIQLFKVENNFYSTRFWLHALFESGRKIPSNRSTRSRFFMVNREYILIRGDVGHNQKKQY